MKTSGLKTRILAGDRLVGTFLRTPAPEIVEILARTGLDFICFDAEHAPFDAARLDACMAVARALGFPALVRVVSEEPAVILQAMDAGAVGVVVPHVTDADMARRVVKAAHFGHGGRGFNGGTRWAGYRSQNFAEILEQSKRETVVLAQIEEPEGVDAADEIAAVDGIDALFVGPADLSIAYGKTDMTSPELMAAFESVGAATRAHGKGFVTFVSTVEKAAEWQKFGMNVLFIASEQDWIATGAQAAAAGIRQLDD
ncbi:MAG: aldolase/citrate lyase family protein [Paracoccaceae bacterium]